MLPQVPESLLHDAQALLGEGPQPGHGLGLGQQLGTPLLGPAPFGDIAVQAVLDLGQAPAQQAPAFLDPGGPHLQVTAQSGNGGAPLGQALALGPLPRSSPGLVRRRLLQAGQECAELGRPGPVQVQAGHELGVLGAQGGQLVVGLGQVVPGPPDGLAGRLQLRGIGRLRTARLGRG